MNREELNIVVVGHVDHGKSTLIGRLLYDTNSLLDGEVERVEKISKERGKSFEYAYLLDAFEEEQTQGITIDTTRIRFSSDKRDYIIIDAPGHKEFLKNMISGASAAEAALLLIDGNEGVREQSKRHGYILSLLGIKKVVVIVNKMDLIDYSEEKFNAIKEEYGKFLNNISVFPINYIPISAFEGENLIEDSEQMPWYKGYSVVEQMDSLEKSKSLNEKPLRLPIQDVYKFDSRRIIAGRIESGTIKVGDEITIYPSNKKTKVNSIEVWPDDKEKKDIGVSLESVGIRVNDEYFFKRGELICKKEEKPYVGNIFNTNIFWMGNEPLVKGKEYKLKIATGEVKCTVALINKVIDSSNLEEAKAFNEIKKNEVGEVTISTKEVIAFDKFSEFEATGRFVIVDGFDVCGGGIISGVVETLQNRTIKTENKNVALRERLVNRKMREEKLKQQGKVIWLTGLPGCGKNEIAIKLEKLLHEMDKKVYYLDSAAIRYSLSNDLGFSKGDSLEAGRRIAEVANLFKDTGFITIVTSVSPFIEGREIIKSIIGEDDYLEIYIEGSSEVLEKRKKGMAKEWDQEVNYERSSEPVISIHIEDYNFNSSDVATGLIKYL
ncbi:MAG: GTP-binding protein [Sarcina sp.]